MIPVDQKNADRSALMGAIRVVKNGGAVLIFPEGSRSPDGKLQSAQPGIGMIAAKTGAPVVPVRVSGSFEAFPRGRHWPRMHPVTVAVGAPLHFPADGGRDSYQDTSAAVLKAVAALPVEVRR